MIENLLDNEVQVNCALLCTGHRELTISPMERALLQDLRCFLQPFKNLTTMVSGNLPHLGLVTLIRHEIEEICTPGMRDSSSLKALKQFLINNLDNRLPASRLTQLAALLDSSLKDIIQLSQDEKVNRIAYTWEVNNVN